ncbi:immune-induced peptide 23 [Scaptodrosophila lebanonensis]|uniref:Immune-induced peptide 23 n=1 Tax=Drosophila lebanonensis TaxID=7225 RepID=A0A6J2T6K2_DROLE|nr:immune-induced peptide 23 [Scaptodrosophila lebanonensis]
MYLKCLLLLLALPALIGAFPSNVVINGVCLTCPNPHGEPVIIDGQEYRSFKSGGSSVILNRPGYNNGRGTVYSRGGNTVINGRCEICNVDV